MPIYSYAELKGKIKVGDRVRAVKGDLACNILADSEAHVVARVDTTGAQDEAGIWIEDCFHFWHEPGLLELLTEEKTLDTVDVGDVVVNVGGEEITILDKSPNGTILFLSRMGKPTYLGGVYTRQEMKDHGLTVKQSEPKPAVKEMTLAEVSALVGQPVKIVE